MKLPAGLTTGNYKSVSRQLQKNPVNVAVLIAMNCVIITVIFILRLVTQKGNPELFINS